MGIRNALQASKRWILGYYFCGQWCQFFIILLLRYVQCSNL